MLCHPKLPIARTLTGICQVDYMSAVWSIVIGPANETFAPYVVKYGFRCPVCPLEQGQRREDGFFLTES